MSGRDGYLKLGAFYYQGGHHVAAWRHPEADIGAGFESIGGGGAGTTWLVGSAEDVARSLNKYRELGITQFVLSDTPYLPEIRRQGEQLLPLLV